MCGLVAGIAMAASGIGEAAQMQSQEAAQAAQQSALQLQMQQEQAQAAQQGLARANKEQQILSTQRAQAAASGMSMSSGTLASFATTSYQNYAEDNQIANLNLSANELAINQQIDASQQELHDQMFGDFFSGVGNIAGLMKFKGYTPTSNPLGMQTGNPSGGLGPEYNNGLGPMPTYQPTGNSYDQYLANPNAYQPWSNY